MRKTFFIVCQVMLVGVWLFNTRHTQASQPAFICGVDVSFLPQIEEAGGRFYDADGRPMDVLTLLQAQGVNWVRLRLWHTPTDRVNDLDHTLAMAKRVKALGMGFLLDIHYSDTWADPAHQTKPLAWQTLSFDALTEALYTYTKTVIGAFVAQGTPPDMVQIGNEITTGFLWDDGQVHGEQGWQALITLLQAGIRGVHDGIGDRPMPQIMLHIDSGANPAVSQWFFDHLVATIDFDVIGLSYYPWWQGNLDDLNTNLTRMAERYTQTIVLVETAYPWTLQWADNTHNLVGEPSQLADGYLATPQGQQAFLAAVSDAVRAIPQGKGIGFFYWEPDAISQPSFESSWENLAWFDFHGRLLSDLDLPSICLQ